MEFVEDFDDADSFSIFDELQDTEFFLACTYSFDEREKEEMVERLPPGCRTVIITRPPSFSIPSNIHVIPPIDSSRTLHSKIYCFFKREKVKCVVATFNLTENGLYGGGELLTVLEADLRKEMPDRILQDPSYAHDLANDSVVCCILEYLGSLINQGSDGNGSLSDSWVESEVRTVFVHTSGLNSLRRSLASIPSGDDGRLSVTYLTPFLSARGIQELTSIFRGKEVELTIVTNDPLTFAGSYGSSNFVESIDYLRGSVSKLRFFVWRRNRRLPMPSIYEKDDLAGRFLHMKVIMASIVRKGRTETWTWLTSANLSMSVWCEGPRNLECAILDRSNEESDDLRGFLNAIIEQSARIDDDVEYWKRIRKNLKQNDSRIYSRETLLRDQVSIKDEDLSKGLLVGELFSKTISLDIVEDSGIDKVEALVKFSDLDEGRISETLKVELERESRGYVLDLSVFTPFLPPNHPNCLPVVLLLLLTSDFEYPDVLIERPEHLFTKTKDSKWKLDIEELDGFCPGFDEIIVGGKCIRKEDCEGAFDDRPASLRLRKRGSGQRTELLVLPIKTYLSDYPFVNVGVTEKELPGLATASIISFDPISGLHIMPYEFLIEDEQGRQYEYIFSLRGDSVDLAVVRREDMTRSPTTLRVGVDRRLRRAVRNGYCQVQRLRETLPKQVLRAAIGNPSASPIVKGIDCHEEIPMEKFIVEGARIGFDMTDCSQVIVYSYGNLTPTKPREIGRFEELRLMYSNLDLVYRCQRRIPSSSWSYISPQRRFRILVSALAGLRCEFQDEDYPYLLIEGEKWIFDDLRSQVDFKITSDGSVAKEFKETLRMRGKVKKSVLPLPRSLLEGKRTRVIVHCIPESQFLGAMAETFDFDYSNERLSLTRSGSPGLRVGRWRPHRKEELSLRIPFCGYSREEKLFGIPLLSLKREDYPPFPFRVSVDKTDLILHIHVRRFSEARGGLDLFAITIQGA